MPRILAVDDSATMRKILEMTFIGQDGIQLGAVSSGESALKAAEGGVDLIILDVGMPGMDGYEVASALRGHSVTSGVPILFMASEHNPLDVNKAKASGVEDHVMKPFETQALIDKAKEMLARPRSSGTAVAAAARPPASAPISLGQPKAPAPPAAVPPRPPAPAAPIPGVVAAKPPVPAVAAPAIASAPAGRATASFGAPQGSKPPNTAAAVGASAGPRPPVAGQATPIVGQAPAKRPALELADDEMAGKLSGMGLTPAQIEGVLALSREVIERVVWEVVPTLAETLIREEIKRLTS